MTFVSFLTLCDCVSVIAADRLVWCTGTRVSVPFMKPLFNNVVDPFGKIKVSVSGIR